SKPNPSRSELLLRIQRLESDVSLLKESFRGKIDDDIVDSKPPLMDVRRLPLKAWFRGSTAVEGQCCLTWDEATVAIRFSATLADVIKLDITHEVHSITYSDPDDVGKGYPVLELVPNSVNPDDTRTPDYPYGGRIRNSGYIYFLSELLFDLCPEISSEFRI
ncbi:hypothetical protein B0H11DRAFT_2338774, partial [Mycena galericulata]